ncbi:hypothetical protein [Micromonospora echinospora]|uniref:hypothetical protein n=1 Tax=Micromonospora echinospora TaxID=1877 RepID=UPI002892FC73|nr:hypothetical protein [Micromonospora echinospora]
MRFLRYYEEQRLLTSLRGPSGPPLHRGSDRADPLHSPCRPSAPRTRSRGDRRDGRWGFWSRSVDLMLPGRVWQGSAGRRSHSQSCPRA